MNFILFELGYLRKINGLTCSTSLTVTCMLKKVSDLVIFKEYV